MSILPEALILLALVGSALMAGLFFVFSNTVMSALSKLPDQEAIRAMQSINRVILNPIFIGSFVGTALISLVIAILAIIGFGDFASYWLLTASCLYLFGTVYYTIRRNVPLNEQLDRIGQNEATEFWQHYLKEWTRYNHNRTVASILAVVFFAIGLIQV